MSSSFAPKFSLSGFKMPDRVFNHQGPAAHQQRYTSVSNERKNQSNASNDTKWSKFGLNIQPKQSNKGSEN